MKKMPSHPRRLQATLLAGMLAAALMLPVVPAQAANVKQFSALELGLLFLDPQGLTAAGDKGLDSLFGVSGNLMSEMPSSAQKVAQPLADSIVKVKDQIVGVAKGKSDELAPYLQPYQILDKSPLTYEELDLPSKPELHRLVEQSNDLLKQSSRVSGTIKLSDELLPKLEESLAKLDPGNGTQKAALGIVAVSLANLNLGAAQSVDKLRKDITDLQGRVKGQIDSTRSAMSANPMNAFGMGEDLQVLMGLSDTLPHTSVDLANASTKLPGIIGKLQAIIAKLKA